MPPKAGSILQIEPNILTVKRNHTKCFGSIEDD